MVREQKRDDIQRHRRRDIRSERGRQTQMGDERRQDFAPGRQQLG